MAMLAIATNHHLHFMDNDNQHIPHRRRTEEPQPRDSYFKLRNILNTIFMVGAVIGVCIYIWGDQTIGTIVVLAAMVFKIIESALRFLR